MSKQTAMKAVEKLGRDLEDNAVYLHPAILYVVQAFRRDSKSFDSLTENAKQIASAMKQDLDSLLEAIEEMTNGDD